MAKSLIYIDVDHGPRPIHPEEVSIDKLRLDPENVRFRHLNRVMTEKEIEEYIWNEPDSKILF